MIVAVTGPERLPVPVKDALALVRAALYSVSGATELRTGGARGVDSAALVLGVHVLPEARHHVIAPAAGLRWNRRLVEIVAETRDSVEVTVMPDGTDYLDRNRRLVFGADLLLAFPRTSAEEQRSGTWATVRAARKLNVETRIVPLDASDEGGN